MMDDENRRAVITYRLENARRTLDEIPVHIQHPEAIEFVGAIEQLIRE